MILKDCTGVTNTVFPHDFFSGIFGNARLGYVIMYIIFLLLLKLRTRHHYAPRIWVESCWKRSCPLAWKVFSQNTRFSIVNLTIWAKVFCFSFGSCLNSCYTFWSTQWRRMSLEAVALWFLFTWTQTCTSAFELYEDMVLKTMDWKKSCTEPRLYPRWTLLV